MPYPAPPSSNHHRPLLRTLTAVSVVLLILLAACSSAPPPTAEPSSVVPPTSTVAPTAEPTPLPDQSAIAAAWEAGPHSHTYDLGKGPNTYCSRCHSPQNWDPASSVDLPPNCVTCKFATDEDLRIATTMDFVEEEDWIGISCETCHHMENGVALPGIAWLNTVSDQHETVSNVNELCAKCHLTTSGVSASGGRGVTHAIELGGSAHANWAGEWPQSDRPQYCSDCHDPHTMEPKQCLDCHEDIPSSSTHMRGFNDLMLDRVSCMACHDASGMLVGPDPESGPDDRFVTLVSEVGRDGEPSTAFAVSHSVQWQVSCDRCHHEENPWGLTVLTAAGQRPAEE